MAETCPAVLLKTDEFKDLMTSYWMFLVLPCWLVEMAMLSKFLVILDQSADLKPELMGRVGQNLFGWLSSISLSIAISESSTEAE